MWSGCVALAQGGTSSVKYLMLEAFLALQTRSTWDNSGRSRVCVNQRQWPMAISSTHKNTINMVCWLFMLPCRLDCGNKRIMAFNCSKYFAESAWYTQSKFFWLQKKDFKRQMRRRSLPHCCQVVCYDVVGQHVQRSLLRKNASNSIFDWSESCWS